MRGRKWITALALICAVAIVAAAMDQRPPVDQEMVVWELTKTEIVDSGTPQEMAEGIFVQGYTIEARARSKGGDIVPEGIFRLTMDAFAPYRDMETTHQRAGFWYVEGRWTITRSNASPEATKVRHNPDVTEGTLSAALPFDPTTGAGSWTGRALLSMAMEAGRWTGGEGTLTFGANLEGDLFLPLTRRPETR